MAISTKNLIEILIRAQDDASRQLDKVGSSAAALDKRLVLVSASMAATGAAILTAVSAAAIAGARYADSVSDISERTQTSVETITALGVTLSKTGGQFEDSEIAIRAFAQAQTDAVAGNKLAVAQFERLGISVDQLVGPGGKLRTFDELIPRVAEGFKGLGDEALATDSAVALFGRGATAFIPVLLRGADGFRDAAKEAQAFNAILGGGLQDEASEFGASLDELRLGTTGLKNALAGALNPTLGETVRNLTEAAKALGAFTQAHPQLTNNIFGTVTALTALAAAPAVFKATAAGVRFLQLEMLASAAAAATFGKHLGPLFVMSRTATGQFAGLRATTLGLAAGFASVASVVAGLTAVIAVAVAEHNRLKQADEDLAAASKRAEETLRDQTASAQDQLAAVNQLITAKAELARAAAPRVISEGGVDVAANRAAQERARAAAEARELERTAGIRADLARRARFEGRAETGLLGADKDAPSLPVKLKILPIDPRDFAAQIAAQKTVIDDAQTAFNDANAAFQRVASTPDTADDVKPTEDLKTATRELTDARQKLFDLERQQADAIKNTTRAMSDNEAAILAMAAATGQIAADDAFLQAAQSVDRYTAELSKANAAVDAAVPGSVAHAKAVDQQTEAIRNLSGAQSNLDTLRQNANAREQQQIETANAMARAIKQLTAAQQALAIARGAGTAEQKQKAVDDAELDRLRREAEQAQANIVAKTAGQAAGAPVFGVTTEDIDIAAEALKAYSDGMIQAQQNTAQLSEAQSLLASTGSALFSALTSAALGAKGGIGSALKSILLDLTAAILKMLLLKAIMSAITGGAAAPVGGGGGIFSLAFGATRAQGGGTVSTGSQGRDTELLAVGRRETVLTHDLTDQLAKFLGAQEQAQALNRRFVQGTRNDARVTESVARNSEPSGRSIERLISALTQRERGGNRAGTDGSAPIIHYSPKTTINRGTSFGTEIEDQQAADTINERGKRFARGFVAAPGFTG